MDNERSRWHIQVSADDDLDSWAGEVAVSVSRYLSEGLRASAIYLSALSLLTMMLFMLAAQCVDLWHLILGDGCGRRMGGLEARRVVLKS